ncbi:hypothetical protein [Salinigranum halophilum]|uniref:hypothetical protein n=1 Tax=Salinigranum halophilum TaxID=2565931 RepID=UPI001375F9E2|nr:hypothetical protein [Salinigranum halophilum]
MTIDPTDIDRLTPPDPVTLERPPAPRDARTEFLLDGATETGRLDEFEALTGAGR